MKIERTHIEGLVICKPTVFKDSRGYFFESYNKLDCQKAGIACEFVQDNQSLSKYGTLRGLHFQAGEFAQAKLVRVLHGKVLDVAVDLRPGAKAYGEHYTAILSADNKWQMFIPRGFAHGFVVLSDVAVFSYKCDNYYSKQHESGIRFDDPVLNIDWKIPESDMIISEKDLALPYLLEVNKK